ncbi:MAG: molybdopterin-dependent oxidoreductase alpha subunit, partial [Saprospiraceae bacterium]
NPLEEAGLKRFRNPQKPMDLLLSGTAITDVYLKVKINQDVSLLKAIMKDLLEREEWVGDIVDTEFINDLTLGFENLKNDLEQYSKDNLLELAGINAVDFERATSIIAPAKKIIICWAMGLTQHKNAVHNIKECVNLLLMKGSLGKPGAGTCPVRGHSNVQGDRTVGINHHLSEDLANRIEEVYQFEPPRESGYDIVKAFPAMHSGEAKFFMALGGNIVGAMSDTAYCIEAIERCEMTINISTKLNRTHLHPGKIGIILPTLGRSEKDKSAKGYQYVSVENSMGKVHSSEGVLAPASDNLMSEPTIVCRVAQATFGEDSNVPWSEYADDYSLIRKDIGRVVKGFENYNKKIHGKKEFYLPNNVRELDFSDLPEGRAQFSICPLPDHDLGKNEYLLMTIRSHDQFNTTIYGLDDRYRGVYNERRVLFMNREDMKVHNLKKLDLVDMQSNYNDVKRSVSKFHIVPYDIPRGNLAAYFPETNPLIPIDQYADESQTPISKSVKVRVMKRAQEDQ